MNCMDYKLDQINGGRSKMQNSVFYVRAIIVKVYKLPWIIMSRAWGVTQVPI